MEQFLQVRYVESAANEPAHNTTQTVSEPPIGRMTKRNENIPAGQAAQSVLTVQPVDVVGTVPGGQKTQSNKPHGAKIPRLAGHATGQAEVTVLPVTVT